MVSDGILARTERKYLFNDSRVAELRRNYQIDSKTKVLGSSAFGSVFLTNKKHNPNFEVAIKVLNKDKLMDNIDCLIEEIAILHSLDHPNIVKYHENYNDPKYIYLVMDYVSGKPLFDRIT